MHVTALTKSALNPMEVAMAVMPAPPRPVEIECPACHSAYWAIDPPGPAGVSAANYRYEEMTHSCRNCGKTGAGWVVRQMSRLLFLYCKGSECFTVPEDDRWLAILKEHFPDHPRLRFVVEMQTADRTTTELPDLAVAEARVDMLKLDERLWLTCRDKGSLWVTSERNGAFGLSLSQGRNQASSTARDREALRPILKGLWDGGSEGCAAAMGCRWPRHDRPWWKFW